MPWLTSQSSFSSGRVPPPNLVSFSTPTTSTTSWRPLATAVQASASADELDEQAFSMLMIDMPVRPSDFMTRWPDNIPPNAEPQYTASIDFGGIPDSTIASFTAGQPISANVLSGYFPNGTKPVPMTQTSRMSVLKLM